MFAKQISGHRSYIIAVVVSCVFTVLCGGMEAWADSTTGGDESNTNIAQVTVGPDIPSSNGTPMADQFTGSLRHSIPIIVPPGRNGMQPNLALTYRSGNGNGWVGVGWELEAGSIERNTRKGVSYSADDYILRTPNGTMDLVKLPDSSEYRAKIENGEFLRIVKMDTYWVATDKKGTRYIYGQSERSRLIDPNNSSSTEIFKWCLEMIQDTNDNAIKFVYAKGYGQVYLSCIYYNTPDFSYLYPPDGSSYVKFYLEEDRNDKPYLYTANFLGWTDKRLKTIEVGTNSLLIRNLIP